VEFGHTSQNFRCHFLVQSLLFSARNNSWPLAIFQSISTFGQPKSILVGQFYCTFSMGWQSITYKMSYLQKNGQPVSDRYCIYHYYYVCTTVLNDKSKQTRKLIEEGSISATKIKKTGNNILA